MVINESNILWRDSNGFVRKWIDQKTGDVMDSNVVQTGTVSEILNAYLHECDINDKYCQEGANSNRHPDHDSHITGCTCELRHDCEMTSLCCGAGSHEYVEGMCGACNEMVTFECIECEETK